MGKKKLDLECGRRGARYEIGDEGSVRVDREGFGHKVSAIKGARNETDTKFFLTGTITITDPIKAHINALRHFWGDGRVREANSTFIVSAHVGGGLGVAEAG